MGLRKVDFICSPSEVHRKKTDNFQVRFRKAHLVVGNKKVGLVLSLCELWARRDWGGSSAQLPA